MGLVRPPLSTWWGGYKEEPSQGAEAKVWEELCAPEVAKTHKGGGATVLSEDGWQWPGEAGLCRGKMICVRGI